MTMRNVLGSRSHLSYMLGGQFTISSSKRKFPSATTLVLSAMVQTNFVGYDSESAISGSKVVGANTVHVTFNETAMKNYVQA
jgi:hypothetical protein